MTGFDVKPLFVIGAIAGFFAVLVTAGPVSSAGLTRASDTMSRLKAGTASNHTISFISASGMSSGTITLDMSAAVSSFNGLDETDIDLAYGAAGQEVSYQLASAPGSGVWGIALDANTRQVTFSYPVSSGTPIIAGDRVIIMIGTNASVQATGDRQFLNTAEIGSRKISITAGPDSGNIAVAIVSEDSVSIGVSVALLAPTQFGVQALVDGSARLTWVDSTNGGGTEQYRIERAGTDNIYSLLATVNANGGQYTDSSAEQKTTYRYRIRAVRGALESAYAPAVTVTTTALSGGAVVVPSEASGQQSSTPTDALKKDEPSLLDDQTSADSDTTETDRVSTSPSDSRSIAAPSSTPQVTTGTPTNSSVFSGVREPSPASPPPASGGSSSTSGRESEFFAANAAGAFSLGADASSGADVSLPAGAVPSAYRLAIVPLALEKARETETGLFVPDGKNIPGNTLYDISLFVNDAGVHALSKVARITIRYDDSAVEAIDERTLRIHYWNPVTRLWEALDSSVDVNRNAVTATVDHFSIFALIGDALDRQRGAKEDGAGAQEEVQPAAPQKKESAVLLGTAAVLGIVLSGIGIFVRVRRRVGVLVRR